MLDCLTASTSPRKHSNSGTVAIMSRIVTQMAPNDRNLRWLKDQWHAGCVENQLAGTIPATTMAATIALIVLRASVSIVLPPAGKVGFAGLCQAVTKRSCWPVALLSKVIPAIGAKNSQLPAVRAAIRPACPAQSPLGLGATSQACPSVGALGGVASSASIAKCSRASTRAANSLTKLSFWVWPASVAVLRPAQALRLASGIERGLRTVAPG